MVGGNVAPSISVWSGSADTDPAAEAGGVVGKDGPDGTAGDAVYCVSSVVVGADVEVVGDELEAVAAAEDDGE